jgi:hypothetical protein
MFEILGGLGIGAWLFVCLINPYFHFAFNVFSFTLHIRLGFPHLLNFSLIHCICGQHLNLVGIHLLHCSDGEEQTTSHDAIPNVVASIMNDVRFHILCKQIHVFSPSSL